jgi:proteasome accessory factor B
VPEGVDMKDIARDLFPPESDVAAVLRIRAGRGQSLRRLAQKVTPLSDDLDEVEIRYSSRWELASEVASYGPDVLVVSPSDVREAVIERLKAAAHGSLGVTQ